MYVSYAYTYVATAENDEPRINFKDYKYYSIIIYIVAYAYVCTHVYSYIRCNVATYI